MNILFVGDVVGSAGCEHLRQVLPGIKKACAVDVCIVNGENSADNNGISVASARHILDSGADVITGGNHTLKRRDFYDVLDESDILLRPENLSPKAPGRGWTVLDRGRYQLTVINLLGQVYIPEIPHSPFDALDAILEQAGNPKFCVVDFHAEATAEKKALAFHADGRVSAVIGTHTHVQTADEQILPEGTGFLTDAGMTGPTLSVLGVCPEQSIRRIRDKLPTYFSTAPGECRMDAVLITLDDATGKTVEIRRIQA